MAMHSPGVAEETLQKALAVLDARPMASASTMLGLLRESAPHFQGRGTDETGQLRAFLMAKIAAAGLAADLTVFALEDLETGQSAYTLAAAARVLRLSGQIPDEGAALLSRAVRRLKVNDEFVDLEHYPPLRQTQTTALAEVERAIQACRPRAANAGVNLHRGAAAPAGVDLTVAKPASAQATSCCCASDDDGKRGRDAEQISGSLKPVLGLEVEDQDGVRATLGDLLLGRPSLLTFFYTRCMNPLKCSRTISQLAALRKRLDREAGAPVLLAAMSYDPAFDLPDRLARYGRDRALPFSHDCMLVRTTGPFQPMAEHLGLGVGYGDTTVNAHRIEWLVTDRKGNIAVSGTRKHWDEDRLVALFGELAG